jgi:hypothetical protein
MVPIKQGKASEYSMAKRTASPKQLPSWSWQLKIELLDVTPAVWRRLVVPSTGNACPPEDVGGALRCAEFLAAIAGRWALQSSGVDALPASPG